MKTRSQKSIDDINFEEATNAWMKNKIKLKNGVFKYKCIHKTKNGLQCKNKPKINCNLCYRHI